jgi:hypothetical protein
MEFEGIRPVSRNALELEKTYSICTLVTKKDEYIECVNSFKRKGFTVDDCEYLYIDNSAGNEFDAYSGYNIFLQAAAGRYIILCHQDVLLIGDDRDKLDELLVELDRVDPRWGLCGNAGKTWDGTYALRISDPHTANARMGGPFPVRTFTLDENFIVVRKHANIALSRDMSGFHLYATDMCIIADILGYNAYVIDFHLHHKGAGNIDNAYDTLIKELNLKYRRAFRPRWLHLTTGRSVYVASSAVRELFARLIRKLRRLRNSCGLNH